MGKEDIKNNRDRETVDVSESFNFTKETNNDPMTNEFFVYHYEENKKQLGGEENKKDIGKEVNDDVDKAQEVKIEDISKVTKVTNAASTAVHTAVVATTTVVVVVAGGAAVTELSYAKPNIHEFNAIEVVGNAFTYTLRIGDSDDSIDNGLENKSCNVVVELKLDSYKETVNVNKYGSFTGTFENLRYDTEYTLTAYEYSTLDIGGLMPHLLVTTQVRTKPESHNNVTFNRVIDSYQQEHYFVTLIYDDDNNYYSSFAIDVVSLDDGSIVSSSNLREPYTDKQEIIMGQDFDGQGKYRIDVTCLSTNPDDQPQGLRGEGEAQQGIRITLFSQEVDFSTIEETVEEPTDLPVHTLSFRGQINSYGETEYIADFYYTDDVSLESLYFTIYDPQEEVVGSNIYLECAKDRHVDTPIELPLEDMETDWTYGIKVYSIVTPEEESPDGSSNIEATLWFTTTLVLNEVPTNNVTYDNPTLTFSKHTTADYQLENYATLAVFDDPERRFYNYYLEISDGIADVPITAPINGVPSETPAAFKLDSLQYELQGVYTVKGYRTIGRGNDAVTSNFIEIEVDFSAIESSEDPITNNIFFYKTQRQNGEMRVEAMLTSPYEDMQYYSNFNLSLEWQPAGSADPDSRETSLETIYREKQVLSEGLDMNLEDWTYEMHVVVTCISTNPEDLQSGGNATGRTQIEFVNTTIDFNEIPTEYEEYVEPVFNGIEVTRCKTYYDNYNGFLLSVDAYDPCEFWNTYEFQLYSDAQHEEEIGYPMTVFDASEVIRLDNLNDPDDPYTNLADDPSTYYYTVTSYSSDPNSQETEITHISDGEICFASLTPTLTDVCPYVIYTKTALEDTGSGYPFYSMEAELVYANKDRYTNYKLTFHNDATNDREFEFYSDYTCDFNGTDDIDGYLFGTYTVTLTAEESWGETVVLSVEKLEFDHSENPRKG